MVAGFRPAFAQELRFNLFGQENRNFHTGLPDDEGALAALAGVTTWYDSEGNMHEVDPDPEPLVVESVEAITKTVEWGKSESDALASLPDNVMATLDDDSAVEVGVDWADEIPGFDGTDEGAEYTVSGDLVDLPDGVTNPDNVKAEATITVAELDVFFVDDQEDTQLIDALNAGAENIKLRNSITLEKRYVLDYPMDLDLNGYTITIDGGLLAVEGDDITISNGVIEGEVTWWDVEGPAWDDTWDAWWENWREPDSDRVMVSGSNVTFDTIWFGVDVADWYQYQDDTNASNLVIENSWLFGVSLFVSDVEINDTQVLNRIGMENNAAEQNEVNFWANDHDAFNWTYGENGSVGMNYVNASISMAEMGWRDNFTGMYVGKSLKYYGEEAPDGYSEAKPTLDGATIVTDKYGLVWWAINYFKAELHVTGDVDMTSTPIVGGKHSGPALMLVGTCYQDYQVHGLEWPGDKIEGDYDGGKILGDATFKGADVWFGKPTQEYMDFKANTVGDWIDYEDENPGLCDKRPVCIKHVDYQVCKKDADRLYIHGHTWEATVNIFTPSNKYIGCVEKRDDCSSVYEKDNYNIGSDILAEPGPITTPLAPFADSVWLGDGNYDLIHMWGDFDIINRKTVDFNQLVVECHNIRRIGTEEDLGGVCGECVGFEDFARGGTLRGGTILGSTCKDGVLVLGDGLLVENVVVDKLLRNLILETTKLEGVDLYVGEEPTNDTRRVCGTELEYDVTVWQNNHAIFSNVMYSTNTDIEVRSTSKLSFAGDIDNRGTVKFQKLAHIGFIDPVTFAEVDPRDGHTTEIDEPGDGYVYVDVERGSTLGWAFNDWKNNVKISSDVRMISNLYQFGVYYDYPDDYEDFYFDLTDADNYWWAAADGIKECVWLTDILYGEGIDFDSFGDNDRE